jgi:hypothetical protein
MAVGVAKPRAQGQAMTITAIPRSREKTKFWLTTNQIEKVSKEVIMIAGTKYEEMLSATL